MRTALNQKDKRALANALRNQVEAIIMSVENRDGYNADLEHLDPKDIEDQLNRWLDKLP